jgi:hypothetical protein
MQLLRDTLVDLGGRLGLTHTCEQGISLRAGRQCIRTLLEVLSPGSKSVLEREIPVQAVVSIHRAALLADAQIRSCAVCALAKRRLRFAMFQYIKSGKSGNQQNCR